MPKKGEGAEESQPEPNPTPRTSASPEAGRGRKGIPPKAKPKGGLRHGRFAGRRIEAGDTVEVDLKVSETVTHQPMRVPVTVARGEKDGPILFVTSALHGDEINGIAVVRRLLDGIEKTLVRGTLVAVPVANRFGFDARDRYLPDRRDLNRAFPGDARGHMAARIAQVLFRQVVLPCDAGIDLHTAAAGNTNLCHIRGDADDTRVRPLMRAFGIPVMVHGDGPRGSLRRAATDAGIPTILFEAGEPGRFQRHVVQVGHQGLLRLMHHLGMVATPPPRPKLQILVRSSAWVRSDHGGILDLGVEPGDLVRKGQALGSIHEPLGKHVDQVEAPHSGVVLGTSTSPLVFPGMAIVHIGRLDKTFARAEAHVKAGGDLGHLSAVAAPRRRKAGA
ncbi:MAG: succinylglutamate desuccinylase/aspartoacylase family protein [Thermoplasmatota archaeon]|nr:succinylglutamate desuccinylase/aspartoacylase family protein [Halobacteriales archaeon]